MSTVTLNSPAANEASIPIPGPSQGPNFLAGHPVPDAHMSAAREDHTSDSGQMSVGAQAVLAAVGTNFGGAR